MAASSLNMLLVLFMVSSSYFFSRVGRWRTGQFACFRCVLGRLLPRERAALHRAAFFADPVANVPRNQERFEKFDRVEENQADESQSDEGGEHQGRLHIRIRHQQQITQAL